MKKISLLIFLCGVCFAADKPRIVRWGPSEKECSVLYANGTARERITDAGRIIDVHAPILRDKHTFQVLVGVINVSNSDLDVNPDNMGGLAGDANAIVMRSVDGDARIDKATRSAHRWSMLGAALSGFGAGYGSSATVNNSDGSTSTVNYHDDSATRHVQQDAAAHHSTISATGALEGSRLLRHNTVAPGNFVMGYVYVEKPKEMSRKDRMGSFVVDFGDSIYIFPYVDGKIPH